jgi:D-sedoheptulose 7-phosphate isomerase
MTSEQFIDDYLRVTETIVRKISRTDINRVVDLLYEAWKADKQVFLAGNGGSASTATHFASDLNKYASELGKKRFRAIALTDNMPLITALVNDEGWEQVYTRQLDNLMREGDLLVAISVHGGSGSDRAGPWSQNLLRAVKAVKARKGKVIGLLGFEGGVLRKAADASIVVPADSTPQVEGFHLILTHLISEQLRNLIGETR